MRDRPDEDKRLTEYRKHVRFANSLGSFRVFCGFLGLTVLFLLSLMAILNGTEGGLFDGGLLAVFTRFGKFAFYAGCLWGLLGPWRDYSAENGKECTRRKEMLAQMEQDPDWWRKRDEDRQQRKKEQDELEGKLAAMGFQPDPDYWKKALEHSHESLATLTRQIRDPSARKTKL